MAQTSGEQAPESTPLLRSPLHERHVELGAKFSAFGGWEMPLEYPTGTVKEHLAVRTAVGIFDVSHLGKLTVAGPGAAAFINRCFTNDLDRIEPGKAQYTLCCDEATGGVVDDLIVYYRDADHVLLVPNAANTDAVRALLEAAKPAEITITDHHRDHAVLAIQGTKSDEVLAAVGLPAGHEYMSFVTAEFKDTGHAVVVCRTGYTGERGYELIVANEIAVPVWDALLAAGAEYDIVPAGLGARDTLRTEMGYPLHGQDITIDTTPVEARLGWAVGWKKQAFWGRDVLTQQKADGPKRTLRGLLSIGRGIPRPGMGVFLTQDVMLGEITSGTFSPTLKKGIGLAYLPANFEDGLEVAVNVRGRRELFTIVKPPFVDPSVKEA